MKYANNLVKKVKLQSYELETLRNLLRKASDILGSQNQPSNFRELASDIEEVLSNEESSQKFHDGYVLVPQQMELTKEDVQLIMFHCVDESSDDDDDKYSPGLLWVGEVISDDGSKTYGLNIASLECLEEGSSTLVEFTNPLS